jgi:bifunctional ADP-heptose synthase (sugar kinase/adenylyltransferase)
VSPDRFREITARYPALRLAIVGDFCLDRYFDIDPTKAETSIETGLTVHNITGVRCQPGAAGTILNNLVALGVGTVWPVGFCGEDGEGWELVRALKGRSGVRLDFFGQAAGRNTFTYTKPLIHRPGLPPEELNRLDLKNWSPTPARAEAEVVAGLNRVAAEAEAIILMDQVDTEGTGVVTTGVLEAVRQVAERRATLPILADSRRGLRGYPPVIFKMNAAELAAFTGVDPGASVPILEEHVAELARRNGRAVFVTMSGRGIIGATEAGDRFHVGGWPVRGPIDIVGAGDAVTANLSAALAAGATIQEAMQLAMAAANIVIHQLGTTGTASVAQIGELVL